MIVIDQINLHHCKEAASELCRRLNSRTTHLSLIQEPYVLRGKVMGLGSTGKLHYVASLEAQARACVFTSSRLRAVMLAQFSHRDFVAVRVRLGSETQPFEVVICSAYLPYDGMVPTRELRAVTEFCSRNNLHLIVGSDANSHHVLWGSSDTNNQGVKLMEFICEQGLVILNRGNRPTFVNRLREEVIDITVCSQSIQTFISGWHVCDEDSLSDHMTIRFSLDWALDSEEQFRNPRRTNFQSFLEKLHWRIGAWDLNIDSSDQLETAVTTLTDSIVMSYQESCPLKKCMTKKKAIWFNDRLAVLKRECNYAWNHRARDGMEAVQVARNKYRKECRKSQRDCWRAFCESVEGVSSTARLHKILSKDRQIQVDTLRLASGEYVSDERDVLTNLLSVHFPECTDSSDADTVSPSNGGSREAWRRARSIATYDDIRRALKSFHPYKSAGVDGIFPALLQHGADILLNPLHEIFSASLALGYIPKLWQQVRVVFIPKPGRASYDEAKSHRPISLSSFLLKTLERLIDWHIRRTTLMSRPLCSNQHAYQRGKSTMTAIHKFTQHVESALHFNEFALACFLDIEGAFDKASFQCFEAAANRFGMDPLLKEWILVMLRNRTLTASLRGTSVSMRPVKGCPQGGVLSPLIWIMIADELLIDLNKSKYHTVGYADDFTITVRGRFIGPVYDRMAEALRIVKKFTERTGFSVNPTKMGLVLFTRKRKVNAPDLFYEGKKLALSPSWKMLGLLFDSKLNWGPHLESRITKACMVFGQCRRAIGRTWGLSPKCTLWMYEMIVLPVLTYGAVVWWEKSQQVTVINKLNHLQRMALLAITGAMSTTPTAALETIIGLNPLNVRIEATARSELYWLHCWQQLEAFRGEGGHVRLWRGMVAEEPLWLAPPDHMTPAAVQNHSYGVIIPTREDWQQGFLMHLGAECVVFTDGSLCEGLAGAGIFSASLELELSFSLGQDVTVFQAEIFAIAAGASACLEMDVRDTRIVICVDSQAALVALRGNIFRSKMLLECFNLLNSLARHNELFLAWVPGHQGIVGNEKADELARRGSEGFTVGNVPFVPLSRAWAMETIREWARKKTLERWLKLDSCKHTKSFIQTPLTRKDTSEIRSLDRDQIRLLCGVISGHYTFRRHMRNMGLVDSSLCPRCWEDEDTGYHVICTCPALAHRRHTITGRHVLSEEEASKLRIDDILRLAAEINFD